MEQEIANFEPLVTRYVAMLASDHQTKNVCAAPNQNYI